MLWIPKEFMQIQVTSVIKALCSGLSGSQSNRRWVCVTSVQFHSRFWLPTADVAIFTPHQHQPGSQAWGERSRGTCEPMVGEDWAGWLRASRQQTLSRTDQRSCLSFPSSRARIATLPHGSGRKLWGMAG